jgi:hypothetical protein
MRFVERFIRFPPLLVASLILLLGFPLEAGATQTVPILGYANSLVLDSTGTFVYVSTGQAVLQVDLATRHLVQQFTYNVDYNSRLGDIDESDSTLSLAGFSKAGTLNLDSGTQLQVLSGSSLGGALLVGGVLYVPDFNNRSIQVAALDGSFANLIPYPPNGPTVCPRGITHTADRSLIVFGDSCQKAFHLIDPATQSLIGTVPVGIQPDRFALVSADLAVVVDYDDGTVAFSDLAHPTNPPVLMRIPSLANVTSVAVNTVRNQLLIAHRALVPSGRVACPDPDDDITEPEIVVVDIGTKKVVERFRLDVLQKLYFGSAEVNDIKVTPDGGTLLVASNEALYFVDLTTRCKIGRLTKERLRSSLFYCLR